MFLSGDMFIKYPMNPRELREYFRKGALVVVQVTPFNKKEEIDFDGLKENTEFLVENRKHGPLILTPTGSTGEFYVLNDEEWRNVIKTVVDVANGKVPVVVGAGHAGTRAVIERAKYAEDIGADGVMVVLPYYHVPSEEGLYLHYKSIGDAINIGLVIYNNPDVSKIYINPRLLKRIADSVDNLVAIKENTPYVPTLYEHIRTIGDKIPIFQGRGEWWFAATAFLGVNGYVSHYANFMPKFSLEMLKVGLSGDFKKLKELLHELEPFIRFISKMQRKYGPSTTILPYPYADNYIEFSVTKSSMDILGLRGGFMCLPLVNIDEADRRELEKILFEDLRLQKIK